MTRYRRAPPRAPPSAFAAPHLSAPALTPLETSTSSEMSSVPRPSSCTQRRSVPRAQLLRSGGHRRPPLCPLRAPRRLRKGFPARRGSKGQSATRLAGCKARALAGCKQTSSSRPGPTHHQARAAPDFFGDRAAQRHSCHVKEQSSEWSAAQLEVCVPLRTRARRAACLPPVFRAPSTANVRAQRLSPP